MKLGRRWLAAAKKPGSTRETERPKSEGAGREISLESNSLFPKEQLMDYDKCPTAFPSAVLKWKWKVNFPKWILNGSLCVWFLLIFAQVATWASYFLEPTQHFLCGFIREVVSKDSKGRPSVTCGQNQQSNLCWHFLWILPVQSFVLLDVLGCCQVLCYCPFPREIISTSQQN